MEIIGIDKPIAGEARLSENLGIALTRDNSGLEELANEVLMLEGICLVLIENGKATFQINGKDETVMAGEMLFLNYQQSISDIMVSANMQFRAFLISREFLQTLIGRINLIWSLRGDLLKTSYIKISLSDEDIQTVCQYYDLLDKKRKKTAHQQQGIDSLCESFGYEMLDIIENNEAIQDIKKLDQTEYSSIQQHFNRFMQMLLASEQIGHKVNWYAEKLCITPKYLNIICQQSVQKSPSLLIEQELTNRALKLINENKLSIKQISEQLGFSSQSNFGTFLRRVTGKSPQQLRKQ